MKAGYKVVKTLIVAPDFSDSFVNDCSKNLDLDVSLIKADSLFQIYSAYKCSKRNDFPYHVLMRDVLINHDLVVKALKSH